MEITILHVHTPIPVTVLHLVGELDGISDHVLVEECKRQYSEGSRNLVMDLQFVTCLNAAGLVTLRSAAQVFNGRKRSRKNQDPQNSRHAAIPLINVPAEVRAVLEGARANGFFVTYADLPRALESFI